jgi:NADH-quinone oxidoreductase subunit J
MAMAFYLASLVAILATVRVITNSNPVHALLYMVISLLAVAMIFFALGAPFAGALEIIVYAGAIMILFVFAVMMLNLGAETRAQEQIWLTPRIWVGPGLLAGVLFAELSWTLWAHNVSDGGQPLGGGVIDAKQVGVSLFGSYLLLVELASILLLAALIAAYHLGKEE